MTCAIAAILDVIAAYLVVLHLAFQGLSRYAASKR